MALEATVEGGEAELPAIGALRSEIEAGGAEPGGHHFLAPMAGLEDAERCRLEVPAVVFRRPKVIVLDLAQAFAPKTRGADIVPWRPCPVASEQHGIDRRTDGGRDLR